MVIFFGVCNSTCVGEGDRGEEPDLLRVVFGFDPVTISVIVCDNLLGDEEVLLDVLLTFSGGDKDGIANVLL